MLELMTAFWWFLLRKSLVATILKMAKLLLDDDKPWLRNSETCKLTCKKMVVAQTQISAPTKKTEEIEWDWSYFTKTGYNPEIFLGDCWGNNKRLNNKRLHQPKGNLFPNLRAFAQEANPKPKPSWKSYSLKENIMGILATPLRNKALLRVY